MGWPFILLGMALATQPRPSFVKADLFISNQRLLVEIADTPEKRSYGLMFKRNLKQNEGMLFIFPREEVQTFWMKNTFIPLSIGFFDKTKVLREIKSLRPVSSELELNPDQYKSQFPAMYVLEVSRGWYEKHGIKVGTKFRLSSDKNTLVTMRSGTKSSGLVK